ncbi:UNVERIFIED_CONTAM: hypothetical protein Sangu_3055900 [Sesamum angustifolium]|uniref:Uncharacterized protein n=1 Tax=Sesamum angustifolium TaxID=2727405 RepID=A0AAW2KGQ5_9LAMI
MKDDKEAFFVVQGDLVGVYKSLSDCQAQVGTSDLNSEADAQANLAVDLAGKSFFPIFLFRYQTLYRSIHLDLYMTAEGQVQEEIDK